MKKTCFLSGRKTVCAAVFAVLAAFIALAACSGGSGSSDESYDNPYSPNYPDTPYNPSNPTNPDNPDNPDIPDVPDPQPSSKEVGDLLKQCIGEAYYNNISEEIVSNINITAQTIQDVARIFPVLEQAAKDGQETVSDISAGLSEVNRALVAQEKGYINATKFEGIQYDKPFYTFSYSKAVAFTGEFNLSEIFIDDNNGKGDFSTATVTSNTEGVTIGRINAIRGNTQPTLQAVLKSDGSDQEVIDIYNLYKSYPSNKFTDLFGDLGNVKMDGKTIYKAIHRDSSKYTLFTPDGNEAKRSGDSSITTMDVNTLIKMTKQFGIYKLSNMIISGTPDAANVNWRLRNMVFEGDMSQVKNTNHGIDSILIGVVYFKDKPYNNVGMEEAAYGLVKLDKLQGVDGSNFEININGNSVSMLDLRGVNKETIGKYTPSDKIVQNGGDFNAIYFNETIDKSQNETMYKKFINTTYGGIYNIYYGSEKMYGNYSTTFMGASKNPRTLKEFEQYGNSFIDNDDDINSKENNNYKMHFSTSAYESYKGNFEGLTQEEKTSLEEDHYSGLNRLAQTDNASRCFS